MNLVLPNMAKGFVQDGFRLVQECMWRFQSADADTRADAAPRNPSVRPRAVLMKLASRRTKGHIMDARSKLKNNPYIQDNISYAVYIGDDLTKRRATLAFRARKLRGEGLIQDTWVMNCKIWVKDNRGRITQIYVEDDLKKFNPR